MIICDGEPYQRETSLANVPEQGGKSLRTRCTQDKTQRAVGKLLWDHLCHFTSSMKDNFPGSWLTHDKTLLIPALIDRIQGLEAKIRVSWYMWVCQSDALTFPTDLREEPMDTTTGEAKGVQTGKLKVFDYFLFILLCWITIFRFVKCQIHNAFYFCYIFTHPCATVSLFVYLQRITL